MTRVLVAVGPFMHRQALAYAIRRHRPGVSVLAVPPRTLDPEAARLAPDVVVCHLASRALRASARSWVELGKRRAAEATDADDGGDGPPTWTIEPAELAAVLAAVDAPGEPGGARTPTSPRLGPLPGRGPSPRGSSDPRR